VLLKLHLDRLLRPRDASVGGIHEAHRHEKCIDGAAGGTSRRLLGDAKQRREVTALGRLTGLLRLRREGVNAEGTRRSTQGGGIIGLQPPERVGVAYGPDQVGETCTLDVLLGQKTGAHRTAWLDYAEMRVVPHDMSAPGHDAYPSEAADHARDLRPAGQWP
jgi:hypothetical protein